MTYYTRTATANTDGSPLFASDMDLANEQETVKRLEAAWRCEIRPFGRLCPVDFYALRHGRIVAVLELKSRTHARNRYPTVWLNVRKWLAMQLAACGLGCPALFVVRFTDGLYYAPVSEISTEQVRIGGTDGRVKSHSDVEPVIDVPVDRLREVR